MEKARRLLSDMMREVPTSQLSEALQENHQLQPSHPGPFSIRSSAAINLGSLMLTQQSSPALASLQTYKTNLRKTKGQVLTHYCFFVLCYIEL